MRSRQRFEGQSAVIMQLAVIGEISKRLSAEFRKCVSLPWRQIARFRDRAVPDYYQLDLEYVWLTIQDDIPLLRNALEMPPDGSQRLDLDVGGLSLQGDLGRRCSKPAGASSALLTPDPIHCPKRNPLGLSTRCGPPLGLSKVLWMTAGPVMLLCQ